MLLIVINLFVHTLLFTIYLSFLVIINSILSAGDSWVGRGCGPWVPATTAGNILEKTMYMCVCIYVYIRGGTVHRCHGSVRTSVQGSRFDTISVQQEKKANLLCSVSFHLF